jgi:hypothetical protein
MTTPSCLNESMTTPCHDGRRQGERSEEPGSGERGKLRRESKDFRLLIAHCRNTQGTTLERTVPLCSRKYEGSTASWVSGVWSNPLCEVGDDRPKVCYAFGTSSRPLPVAPEPGSLKTQAGTIVPWAPRACVGPDGIPGTSLSGGQIGPTHLERRRLRTRTILSA